MTGAGEREGDGAGGNEGGRRQGRCGGAGQHQREDGHACACRAIGIHSGVEGGLGLGPLTPDREL